VIAANALKDNEGLLKNSLTAEQAVLMGTLSQTELPTTGSAKGASNDRHIRGVTTAGN
jgi:hypothetical protein